MCTPTLLLLIILLLPPCNFILFPKLKFKLKGHNSGLRSRIQHRCLTESGHSETSRERCINSSRAGSITVVPQDTLLKTQIRCSTYGLVICYYFLYKGSFDFIWYVQNICLEQPSEKYQLNTAGQMDQTQFDDKRFNLENSFH